MTKNQPISKWFPVFFIMALSWSALVPAQVLCRFAVIGDVRPEIKSTDHIRCNPFFLPAIDAVNLLAPDLVLINGDLIYGGKNPEAQWQPFDKACKKFTMPIRLIEGNHDIWDKASLAAYERHCGPIRYGFEQNGVYFIVLDTVEKWSDLQLRFLADQLKIAGRKPTFVFLHIPLWWPGGRLAGTPPQNRPVDEFWAAKVHPLLVRAGNVQAVFASHEHFYVHQKFDGIDYVISGGGGAEPKDNGGEITGSLRHFLMVAAQKDKTKTRISLLTLDGVRPIDTQSPIQRYIMLDQAVRLRHWPEADTGDPMNETHRVDLENPFADPMEVEVLSLVDPKSKWMVSPIIARTVIAPGKKSQLTWQIKTPKAAEPAPIFIWKTRCGPRFSQEQSKIWIH